LAWRKIQFVLFGVTSFVRQTKQVGQYWLIIKENGTNCVNFVGNCRKFVENIDMFKICTIFRKIFVCPKIFFTPKMVHCPKIFLRGGWGGGGVVEKNFLRKKFFGVTKYQYFWRDN
jgi:hypothetical protein